MGNMIHQRKHQRKNDKNKTNRHTTLNLTDINIFMFEFLNFIIPYHCARQRNRPVWIVFTAFSPLCMAIMAREDCTAAIHCFHQFCPKLAINIDGLWRKA